MNNLYCKLMLESMKTMDIIELYKGTQDRENKQVIEKELKRRGFNKPMLVGYLW